MDNKNDDNSNNNFSINDFNKATENDINNSLIKQDTKNEINDIIEENIDKCIKNGDNISTVDNVFPPTTDEIFNKFNMSENEISNEYKGKKKTAILIINNGNPKSQNEFSEFFKYIFTSVNLPFQKSIGSWIASKYSKIFMLQDQNCYNNPRILNNLWSLKQKKIFELYMNKISPLTAPHKLYYVKNNGIGKIPSTLRKMISNKISKVIVIFNNPHYSDSYTSRIMAEIQEYIEVFDKDKKIGWKIVDNWANYPELIECFVKGINEKISTFSDKDISKIFLLFCAQSTYSSFNNEKNGYKKEVISTVQSIISKLRNEYSYTICWQTPNGITEKLGPNIGSSLKNIKNNGFSQVLLVPLIFSMDLLERMFINEIETAESYSKKIGINEIKQIDYLCGKWGYIKCIANMVYQALNNEPILKAGDRKYINVCKKCLKKNCSKHYKLITQSNL
ncbi:chelatase [Neocallimastix lanati (nom. inval.)]|jgi:protoheme ferro-lyase|uniref:Chelatase n=1 Tax=Neocallimastix californiae TaxID=1754190 RepID=A0A1Y2C411_9FUNG|nr:chelatase [Neocallimastix sp. JGI-2020a]ORY41768.1 chelatase [Neocallimastix californiae]|eukprot:ORY41768.1 chelatase [Neocallimastix californiae]